MVYVGLPLIRSLNVGPAHSAEFFQRQATTRAVARQSLYLHGDMEGMIDDIIQPAKGELETSGLSFGNMS